MLYLNLSLEFIDENLEPCGVVDHGEVFKIRNTLDFIRQNGIGDYFVLKDIVQEETSHKMKCKVTQNSRFLSLNRTHMSLYQVLRYVKQFFKVVWRLASYYLFYKLLQNDVELLNLKAS